jgi:spermidine/putrescine transport system permease protein
MQAAAFTTQTELDEFARSAELKLGVVSNFNAGQTVTFPLFVYGAAKQGVPPQVNVLATAMLLFVVLLMFVNLAFQRRSARRQNREMETTPALGL